MMDETVLMDHIKDELCFVSSDVRSDLCLSKSGRRSPYFREYVLPDGVNNFRGYVRNPAECAPMRGPAGQAAQQEQVLYVSMGHACAALEHRPATGACQHSPHAYTADIGLQQAGIAEAVVQAVQSAHVALHPLLYTNIILSGGVAACPGLADRFRSELRPLVPDVYDIGVFAPETPAITAWEGMSSFAAGPGYAAAAMTKAQYEETGGSAARR
eukprot:362866-Chlamydomonas_euryale.AAC.39